MSEYLIAFILISALATFMTRALPFILFRQGTDKPLLQYLGRYLPPVMMVLLLIYASTDLTLDWASPIALMVVAVLQWFGRNALLSIGVGTLIYIFLL